MDTDLWIIVMVTMGVPLCYAVEGDRLMGFVRDSSIPVLSRLLVNTAAQFGIARAGITIACLLRKERFTQFGLK